MIDNLTDALAVGYIFMTAMVFGALLGSPTHTTRGAHVLIMIVVGLALAATVLT